MASGYPPTHSMPTTVASPAGAPPTGTVTFLFTDIEGSTRLLERLHARYADVLADQRNILRASFERWHGHEIDTQGDSFFVAFTRAAEAIRCAIDAQAELAAWSWPDGAEVRVRMGIHTGEPIVATTGYVGMDVHRAARIAAAGHGGQTLLSSTTRDLVADDLPSRVELRDLGSHRLKDLRTDVHLYQLTAAGLAADFPPLLTRPADEPPPTPGEPPYRGLEAFEEEDAALFFGREEVVAELVGRVERARFVALIGASGSGKSSILRAGLVPALRGSGEWRIVLLTPGAHPLEALAAALVPDGPPVQQAELIDGLRADPRTLVLSLRSGGGRRKAGTRRTLVAIDQLEEVFTLCRDEEERQAFLDNLITASGISEGPADAVPDADRATVVLTLRADFYAHLAPYPPLREAAAASQLYVGQMSADELRRAIEEPARQGGWEFTAGLVELLLRDVGDEPGALPLLSHALLETWRRRRGVTMTLRSYAESGGVKGAIARTADRVYETELTDEQRPLGRDIFVRLTELGEGTQDTRRRVRLDELLPAEEQRATAVRQLIMALADARLITVGQQTVEVAHEALIREWPTLREWLNADREGLRLHRRLTEAAAEWQLAGQDEGLLFRGARLAQGREWATANPAALNEQERLFLSASVELAEREEAQQEAQRRRETDAARALARSLRQRALLLAGGLLVAVVLAGAAVVLAGQSADNARLAEERAVEARDNAALADQRAAEALDSEALAQARATQARAQRLAADATQVLVNGHEPELAALLAVAGLNADYTTQGDAALQRAGRQISGARFEHDAEVIGTAVTPDGRTLFTAAGGSVHIWDVETATEIAQLTIPTADDPDAYPQLWLTEDGTTLLASDYFGGAVLWRLTPLDPTSAQEIATGCEALKLGIHAMSGDGRVIASYDDAGIRVWRMPECEPIGEPIPAESLNDPALSDDGSLLAASVQDNSVMAVWDVESGREITRIPRERNAFWHPSFSADGSTLAVGMFDGTAQMFDVDSGLLLKTYRGHSDPVERAVLSVDGTRLLTNSLDGTARLWDTTSATELRRFAHDDAVWQSVLTVDGTIVFTASSDGTARQWSAEEEGFSFKAGDVEVTSLSFSGNGTKLVSAAGDSIRVFDMPTERVTVDAPTRRARLVAFSPASDTVLAVSAFQSALIDATDGHLVMPPLASSNQSILEAAATSAATFSADGRLVLAPLPAAESAAILYDATTGRAVTAVEVESAVLAQDGSRIAGWEPGHFWIFDAATGAVIGDISLGEPTYRRIDLQFTPDGSRLVSGDDDNVVRVRDIATQSIELEMRGHGAPVRQVRVSADGRFVLSAGDDGGARLWSLETGQLVRYFAGYAGLTVTSIAISPDGEAVALGSTDGSVVVAPTSLEQLAESVCARLGRDLTPDERSAYGIEEQDPTCR